MHDSDEVRELRQIILDDESALQVLNRREAELLEHMRPRDFHAATTREHLLADMHAAEERLHKNRLQLSALV